MVMVMVMVMVMEMVMEVTLLYKMTPDESKM
jgi:hypothetical protein